ncbi:MAG TPA: hypothetical protein VHS54_07700 [Jatrophihabitans sp.]|nr:hypothetical protein [Jatrophihabitans sp.]
MSESLDRTVEITKLARLLGVEAKELAYLDEIPSPALAAFRAQATDRLFAGDADRLRRVAGASRLVPVPLTVKIAQLAFGPLLCAATAGLLDPKHAVKVASSVPVPFLADIAVHLDPRRAADVIAAVPSPIVVKVAKELIGRGEHVTIGRFVSFLPIATLRAAVPEIADDGDLLRVAFVMEGKDNLNELLDIARERVPGLIQAAYQQDLWVEALDLIGHLSLENRAELAEVAATQDVEVLESLVRAAHRIGAWDALLPVAAAMDEEGLRRFAAVLAVAEPDVLDEIVSTALNGPLWLDLLPLTAYLPEPAHAHVAARAAEEDDETLGRLAAAAHEGGMWDAMLPIAVALPVDAQRRLAKLPLLERDDVVRELVRVALATDTWSDLLPLTPHLTPEARAGVAARTGEEDDTVLERLATQAYEAGLWEPMLLIAAAFAPRDQERLARLPLLQRDDVRAAALQAGRHHDLPSLVGVLTEPVRRDGRHRRR